MDSLRRAACGLAAHVRHERLLGDSLLNDFKLGSTRSAALWEARLQAAAASQALDQEACGLLVSDSIAAAIVSCCQQCRDIPLEVCSPDLVAVRTIAPGC